MPRREEKPQDLECDVVVIGSGASGSVACQVLVDNGYSVVCVEKGGYWLGQFPTDHFDWESLKPSLNPNLRNSMADYFIDTSDSPIDVANFNGVGGSTVFFSGHYPRFHPSDFRTMSLDGVGVDWPFDYDQLAPFYLANEKFLGVAGLCGDPAYPDMMSHLATPVPLGVAGETLANTLNDLGWHWWPSYSAIKTVFSNDPTRSVCKNIGQCNTGCPIGAKGSADVTFLADALSKGLKLIVNTTALSVIRSNKGAAAGVVCRDEQGKTFKIYSRAVMLAANALGSLRVLSGSTDNGDYLGNSSDQVGRNFMIHPLGYVEGVLAEVDCDSHIGPQGSWIASHEFYETDADREFKRGYSLQFLKNSGPVELSAKALIRRKLDFGANFLEEVKLRLHSTVGVAVICEDLPAQENMVVVVTDRKKDKDGLPKLKIRYEISENTRAMMSHGIAKAKIILQSAGASDIRGDGPVKFAGWHLTGTTRMGNDPLTSVVAPNGEFHDVPGLFAIDGGVFPTSAGVNPAATIQAVARKIALEFCSG